MTAVTRATSCWTAGSASATPIAMRPMANAVIIDGTEQFQLSSNINRYTGVESIQKCLIHILIGE
jgi:hypothetical protein